MPFIMRILLFFSFLVIPAWSSATLKVGIGKTDITPPLGTPSAGYAERKGAGMKGIHDPLLATALFIDNGEKQIVLCSVDHLGFTYEMVQEVIQQVHAVPGLKECEIYIGSSHTHSGGGAYLNIPLIGETLAGPYDPKITALYEKKTAEAIIQASQHATPSKIGIGYGKTGELSQYRGLWPTGVTPSSDITVIKVTKLDGSPLAVLFNYPLHPTVLDDQNDLFSSDFVGCARKHLQSLIGSTIQPLYFNGAQGEIIPLIVNDKDRFCACESIGQLLAETVAAIYHKIEVSESLDITTQKESYDFTPQTTPFGLKLPLESYKSEINLIILNKHHAFITIPGELSTLYDQALKKMSRQLGYAHLSIFGLTNDAHGYIILPESWKHKTFESTLSFGGENYGELTKNRIEALLKNHALQYDHLQNQ